MIILETNYGKIQLALDYLNTPMTAENFVAYVTAGFYDQTLFHRVISNFMIQGGGLDLNLESKPTNSPISNESPNALPNKSGTIAMARTSEPHSATSQFFINVVDNDFLNYKHQNSGEGWGYCVFGKVTEGMDVVDKIKKVKTGSKSGYQDVPLEEVIINRAYQQDQV